MRTLIASLTALMLFATTHVAAGITVNDDGRPVYEDGVTEAGPILWLWSPTGEDALAGWDCWFVGELNRPGETIGTSYISQPSP